MRRAISSSVLVLALVGILFSVTAVYAEDYNPPTWRGNDRTTYQRWEFGTDTNPASPEVDYDNSLGMPTASITGSYPYTQYKETYLGETGVWRFEDYISIEIQNWPDPLDYKEIWLQMTFYADGGVNPDVSTQPTAGSVEVVEKTENGDYWNITYDIIIEPNPESETIYIQPSGCTLYISEIVIDTICTPEPLTIGLLGFGGLMLIRRRKR